MLKSLWSFICYWYFRYLMVTELYMVEWWEQVIVNGGFIFLFLLFAYFNYTVVLSGMSYWLPTIASASPATFS